MNLLIVGAAANVTDHLFVEALYFKARDLLNPGLELRGALWIIKARQFLCGVKQPRFYDLIDRNRIFRKDRINADAAVVDMLVDYPEIMLAENYWELLQALPDRALRHDVLTVILNVEIPPFGVMVRKIARALAIDLCSFAGN